MTTLSRLGLIGCFVQLSYRRIYRHCHHHRLSSERVIKLSRLQARDLPPDPEAEQGGDGKTRASLSLHLNPHPRPWY